MAEQDNRLVGITPAMCDGSGMNDFAKRFPKRFEDVAIAEQHAVTVAAGMACEGSKPVVAIYSTFLQRAYDQLIHDVALQNWMSCLHWIAPEWLAKTVLLMPAPTTLVICAVFLT